MNSSRPHVIGLAQGVCRRKKRKKQKESNDSIIVNPKRPPIPKYIANPYNSRFMCVSKRYGYQRPWTMKGMISRLYGQGAWKVFSAIPSTKRVAISGSLTVALVQMQLLKKNLTWRPNDIDIFIAVPKRFTESALQYSFPIIQQWLRIVRQRGFDFHITTHAYGSTMIVFNFCCQNKKNLPEFSFIIRRSPSVKEITQSFDLPICSSVILQNQDSNWFDPILYASWDVWDDLRRHKFHCRVELNNMRIKRLMKYMERGFHYVSPLNATIQQLEDHTSFPNVTDYQRTSHEPFDLRTAFKLLRYRLPTSEETSDFNIGEFWS